jgi:acetyl esterase/lipase
MGFFPRRIDLINKAVGLAGLKISRGLAYGRSSRQVLDVYVPEGAGRQLPVIVFFYGGFWREGERGDYAFVAARLAARGFVVVVPDYRLYPEMRYPGFVEDCAAATEWVMGHIDAFRGDRRAVFLLGHSAGAYNAVMVALATEAPEVAGVVGLAGPYDFLPLTDPVQQAIFAGAADPGETQPLTHVHGAAAPIFLATGAADRTVLPRNTTVLAARLREVGGVVETRIYPNLGHIRILLSILPVFAWGAPVWKDVLGFIQDCRNGAFGQPGSEFAAPMVRKSL